MENRPSPALAVPEPAAETGFDRASWLLLLALLGATALVAVLMAAALWRPTDGWSLSSDTDTGTVLDYFYGDWPTPLQPGDEVLAIDGLSMDSILALDRAEAARLGWQAGARRVYTLRRAGEAMAVPVTVHAPGWPEVGRAAAHRAYALGVLWTWPLLALVVFGRRPRSLAARLLLVAMVSYTLGTLAWGAMGVSVGYAPLLLLGGLLFATDFWTWVFFPTLIWLVLSFPAPVFPWTRWPRQLPWLLYGLPLAASLATLVTGNPLFGLGAVVAELVLLVLALGMALVNAHGPRAGALARAQAAWLLLGLALSQGVPLLLFVLGLAVPALDAAQRPAWVSTLLTLALPVCLGIAILRYRLFDINVIIRRTLLYAGLTAILAMVYWGSVVLIESVLRPVTGQGQNQAAIVVSTLVIAALFGPLRRRVQAVIDRRFDRRAYDAARTLAAFGVEARAETDLAALQARLERVTDETMRPAHVSVWVKPDKKQDAGGTDGAL